MKVMIGQLRYLPCIQHLRRIANADLFVILDITQRASEEFENRNKILINGKEHWLTIPVYGNTFQKVRDSKMDVRFLDKHRKTIWQVYCKEKFFDDGFLKFYYNNWKHFASVENLYYYLEYTYIVLRKKFNIETKVRLASDVLTGMDYDKMNGIEKIKNILEKVGATEYITSENCYKYGVNADSIACNILIDQNKPAFYNEVCLKFPYLAFIDGLFKAGEDKITELIHKDLNVVSPGYYNFIK